MDPDPSIIYDEDAKVDYIDFENLDFPENLSFDSALTLSKSDFWRDIFNASDDLWRLNKFKTSEFQSHISLFQDFICTQVNNLRSSISKNTCVLVEEIFTAHSNFHQSYTSEFNAFLTELIPIIIAKVGYEKKFIQAWAWNALKLMIDSTKSFDLLN